MKKKLCKFFSLIVALTLLLVSCGTATETSSANSTSGNNTNSTPSTNIQDNNIATRKDVVLALFELSDKQINTQKLHPYTDVKNTHDFNPAVQWAYGLGISQDETSFRPLDPVTQIELAQFIFNFAVKVKGVSQNFYENATAYCEEIGLSILREADKTYTKQEVEEIMENYKNYLSQKENANHEDYQNIEFDENNVVVSFALMSDIHIASHQDTYAADKYKKAVDLAVKYSNNKLDMVMVAGDLVQNLMYDDKAATAITEIDAFKMFTDEILPKNIPLLFCTGNHDRSSKIGYEEDFSNAFRATQNDIDRYYKYDVVEDCQYQNGNRHAKVNGYHFLSVGMHQDYVSYLKPLLEKITKEDPFKPVFVQYHFPTTKTVFETHYSDTTQQQALYDVLKDYPQVFFFSGHTHSPAENPRAIWQGDFTAFDTASVRELWDEGLINGFLGLPLNATHSEVREFAGEATLVQVDKNNNVRLLTYNLHRGDVVATRVVAAPNKEKTHLLTYTQKREETSKAPVFENDPNLTLTVNKIGGVDVSFNAASHEEIVWHYSLTFSAQGKEDQTFYFTSGFHKPDGMPKTITGTIQRGGKGHNFVSGETYTVTLTAYDAWEHPSEQVTTKFLYW